MIIKPSITLTICLFSGAFADDKGKDASKHQGKRPNPAWAAEFLKHHDENSDGKVSLEEFAKGKRASQLPEEARVKIFARLDKDSDGFISSNELKPLDHNRRGHFLAKSDEDGDGRVSREEFLKKPPFKGASPERLNKMFDRMDRNTDGFLDDKDPVPGGGRKRPPKLDFKKMDADQSGAVSREEFRVAPPFRQLPKQEMGKLFQKIDSDKDNEISPAEMKAHAGKRPPHKLRRPEPKK